MSIWLPTTKVGNRPDFLMCKWRATYCWKALSEGYNVLLDLTSIGGLHTKLWASKVMRIPILGILGLPSGSLKTKWHLGVGPVVTTPLWAKCEDETHTPKSGDLESSGTLKNLELDCKGQNTSHWGVLYTVGKVLKCKCPKWPRMSHLDICSPSYGQKEDRESN